jgi:hypothetical protein
MAATQRHGRYSGMAAVHLCSGYAARFTYSGMAAQRRGCFSVLFFTMFCAIAMSPQALQHSASRATHARAMKVDQKSDKMAENCQGGQKCGKMKPKGDVGDTKERAWTLKDYFHKIDEPSSPNPFDSDDDCIDVEAVANARANLKRKLKNEFLLKKVKHEQFRPGAATASFKTRHKNVADAVRSSERPGWWPVGPFYNTVRGSRRSSRATLSQKTNNAPQP